MGAPLTSGVFAAVLLGALLHAGWNALIKSGADKSLDTALIHTLGVGVAVPIVAWVGFPHPASWPYIATSIVIHLGYYIALAGAYKHGDLGLTYPVMRGAAPLLVALASGPLVGETLSLQAWARWWRFAPAWRRWGCRRGPCMATREGAALRARERGHHRGLHGGRRHRRAPVGQRRGVRGDAVPLRRPAVPGARDVAAARGAAETFAYMAGRWKLALLGGVASMASYGIALWAMTRAPVASVAALRETAVLFAAVIGVVWLRESFGLLRALGTLLIVGGVAGLRLA